MFLRENITLLEIMRLGTSVCLTCLRRIENCGIDSDQDFTVLFGRHQEIAPDVRCGCCFINGADCESQTQSHFKTADRSVRADAGIISNDSAFTDRGVNLTDDYVRVEIRHGQML